MSVLFSVNKSTPSHLVEADVKEYLAKMKPGWHTVVNIYTSTCNALGKLDMEIEFVSQIEPDPMNKMNLMKNLAITISYYVVSNVLYKYPKYEGITISRKTKNSNSKDWVNFYILDGRILYDSNGKAAGNTSKSEKVNIKTVNTALRFTHVAKAVKKELDETLGDALAKKAQAIEYSCFRSQRAAVDIFLDLNMVDPDRPDQIRTLCATLFGGLYKKILKNNPVYDRAIFRIRVQSGRKYQLEIYIIGNDFLCKETNGPLRDLKIRAQGN